MAYILPEVFYLPAAESKTYYEDLTGGKDATVNVLNLSRHPVELVISSSGAPDATYTISGFNSRSVSVDLLVKVVLSSTVAGPAFGGLLITSLDDVIPTL